jgi:shikimate kinase
MTEGIRIALTGFMGVGKSSVSRHLAHLLRCRRIDLDHYIEESAGRSIADIVDEEGIAYYRTLETRALDHLLSETDARILSLGGGTWTVRENRELLKTKGFTSVWLESTFEHCWLNITFSKKVRPLARSKHDARELFDNRQKLYCLADWHLIIRPDQTSLDVAKQIVEEIFS